MQFEAISYNLPANPSRYRVATWKKLRELGAVYLQDGVAMVPAQAGLHSSLEELRQNIVSWNGRASLLILEFQQEEDEREVLASFAAARQEEYAGIQADAIRLLNQMEEERSRGKGAPDIDRYLLELRRLRRRMETAEDHDFFGADRSAAEQALEDDIPVRRSRRPRPAAARKMEPVPTALETAERLLEMEREEENDEDEDMPVFLF